MHSSGISPSVSRHNVKQPNQISLKPGQMIQGKVLKLYPNHMALVQIGGMKLHAKMEASLTVNKGYLFQVQETVGMFQLKVLEGINWNQSSDLPVRSILQKLGVEGSKTAQRVVANFLSEGIPFTKEVVQQSSEWLKASNEFEKGLHALKWMITKGYPITKAIYDALVAQGSERPLANDLLELYQQLKLEPKQPLMQPTIQLLDQLLRKATSSASPILPLINMISDETATASEHRLIISALKSLGVIPADVTQEEAFSVLTRAVQEIKSQLTSSAPSEALLTNRDGVNSQYVRISDHEIKIITSILERVSSSFGQPSGSALQIVNQLEKLEAFELLNKQSALDLGDFYDPENVFEVLKKLPRLLGLDFEKRLFAGEDGMEKIRDGLKPLLLELLQNESLSTSARTTVEQVIHRLTGLQLLMNASNDSAPLQQLFMQLPMAMGHRLSDVLIEWQGKKQEDGKMDPDFCRMMFFLDLEHLRETTIDVQIQNRVISITVVNDNRDLNNQVQPFLPLLKQGLEMHQYYLSSLRVIPLTENKGLDHQPKGKRRAYLQEHTAYNGVDIKI